MPLDVVLAPLAAFAAVMVCVVLLWLVSIPLRDVSIVDVFWGPGFAVAAWVGFAIADGAPARKWLVTGLTTIWALRLGGYLLWRKWGEGEDPRYTKLIAHYGEERRHRTALERVFLLQGAVMCFVALPVLAAQLWRTPETLGPVAYVGIALWLVGFAFETVGDWQLVRFKADPANAGRVMDRGLWRYTRHPNYFGDCCVWWGLFLIACDNHWGLIFVLSPALMTWFLVKVTGKALLERRMKRSRPGYDAYVARTSGFLPWPPRRQ